MKSIDPMDPSGFVVLTDVIPDAVQEIRYFSTYNFVGDRIDGYEQPIALLTRETAEVLKKVSDEMRSKGYTIKIYDTYRPCSALAHFMRWVQDYGDTRMKKYFYPDMDKKYLFEEGFLSERSGHSRGSTVDLTLTDMESGLDLDMGGHFDFFGEVSYALYDKITPEQRANRMLLREVMLRNGFRPATTEWWHFRLIDEPYPDTYFEFPVNENVIRSIR